MLITGTFAADFLVGTDQVDAIEGLAGNDTLNGGLGNDTLDGGSDNDTAVFDWAEHFGFTTDFSAGTISDPSAHVTASLSTGELNAEGYVVVGEYSQVWTSVAQTLIGIGNLRTGFGNDHLSGSAGSNILSSGDGNDFLWGDRGSDILLGGNGNDTLAGGGGTDILDGGAGLDVADYQETTVDIRANLLLDEVSFPGQTWSPEFLTSIEGIIGGSGNDRLIGDAEPNFLAGSDGNDFITGGGGDDTLDGGYGQDTLRGGGGSDTADYSSVSEDLRIRIGAQLVEFYDNAGNYISRDKLVSIENGTGGRGNDTLLGTDGVNTLNGGEGDDNVQGREDDDVLVLSSGFDSLDGGTGIDTLRVDLRQEISETAILRSEMNDALASRYEWQTNFDADVLVNLAKGIARGADGYTGRSTLADVENVEILGGWGDDTIIGSEADNIIDAGWGANLIRGRGGDDTIYGRAFNPLMDGISDPPIPNTAFATGFLGNLFFSGEAIHGGAGDDTIHGTGQLFGDGGNDWLQSTDYVNLVEMVGGWGADSFVFMGNATLVDASRFPDTRAMDGLIRDFKPHQGDKIVIDLPEHAEIPTYLGETSDIPAESFQYGFWRAGNDLIVHYANNEGFYDDLGLTITLENFSGPFGQDDIVFI
ncbi:MAG: calcium-binding protein [Pseudomonadota bacterium]